MARAYKVYIVRALFFKLSENIGKPLIGYGLAFF